MTLTKGQIGWLCLITPVVLSLVTIGALSGQWAVVLGVTGITLAVVMFVVGIVILIDSSVERNAHDVWFGDRD